MSQYPDNLRYTKQHEWLKIEGNQATVGITSYAAEQLGDVVHVDMKATGSSFEQEASLGTVESVKSVSDIYTPVSGNLVEVNAALAGDPSLVNTDPYGQGWIAKVSIANPNQVESLLNAAQYQSFLSEEA